MMFARCLRKVSSDNGISVSTYKRVVFWLQRNTIAPQESLCRHGIPGLLYFKIVIYTITMILQTNTGHF